MPALTITPKRRKALAWKGGRHPVKSVKQPARKGNPWLARAVAELGARALDFSRRTLARMTPLAGWLELRQKDLRTDIKAVMDHRLESIENKLDRKADK